MATNMHTKSNPISGVLSVVVVVVVVFTWPTVTIYRTNLIRNSMIIPTPWHSN